jgi:ribose transport system ATP-binding protein
MCLANRGVDGLIPSMSLRENVTLPDWGAYWRRAFLHQKREVTDWKGRLAIKAPNHGVRVDALSGGNQQKSCSGNGCG